MSITVLAKTRTREHSPPSESQATRSRSSGASYTTARSLSASSSDQTLGGSPMQRPNGLLAAQASAESESLVNPLHNMSGKGEVHIVKVTGDSVQISEGPMEDSLLQRVGHSLARAIPSASEGNGAQIGLTTSPDDIEPPFPVPDKPVLSESSPVPFSKPFPECLQPPTLLEPRPQSPIRSSTETATQFTSHRQNEAGPSNRYSSYQQSPDGHLLPSPPVTRPKRRNTIGSSTSPMKSATTPQGTANESDLADDIQQAADQIRRERMSKRAKAHAEAERALTRRADPVNGPDNPLVGNLIGEDHVNYVLMYNMLTGIRIGVSRCQAKMKRPLTDEDFTARHKFSFDMYVGVVPYLKAFCLFVCLQALVMNLHRQQNTISNSRTTHLGSSGTYEKIYFISIQQTISSPSPQSTYSPN